jgi:hypothetical protein
VHPSHTALARLNHCLGPCTPVFVRQSKAGNAFLCASFLKNLLDLPPSVRQLRTRISRHELARWCESVQQRAHRTVDASPGTLNRERLHNPTICLLICPRANVPLRQRRKGAERSRPQRREPRSSVGRRDQQCLRSSALAQQWSVRRHTQLSYLKPAPRSRSGISEHFWPNCMNGNLRSHAERRRTARVRRHAALTPETLPSSSPLET